MGFQPPLFSRVAFFHGRLPRLEPGWAGPGVIMRSLPGLGGESRSSAGLACLQKSANGVFGHVVFAAWTHTVSLKHPLLEPPAYRPRMHAKALGGPDDVVIGSRVQNFS